MGYDTHWIDVRLHSGRVIRKLTVRGGGWITGPNGELGEDDLLPFESEDIADLRRHSSWLSWLPFTS